MEPSRKQEREPRGGGGGSASVSVSGSGGLEAPPTRKVFPQWPHTTLMPSGWMGRAGWVGCSSGTTITGFRLIVRLLRWEGVGGGGGFVEAGRGTRSFEGLRLPTFRRFSLIPAGKG